jgi:hypothetical protein
MNAEIDYDLAPDQWEALKTLRSPAPDGPALNRFVLEGLIALQLATMKGDFPALTPKGRKVLVRGSCKLLDVAA